MDDISSIEDIKVLVNSFYQKVLQDALLSPVFNNIIQREQWPGHLQIMVNFWQTNLLFEQSYKGNPMLAHIKVDEKINHTLSKEHFERWLHLWGQTIDENFKGDMALTAKKRAGDMAKLLLYKVEQGHNKGCIM